MQTFQARKNKRKPPLMKPRASITADNQPAESWYSMRALSASIAELRIEGEIGAWGVTAKQFAKDLKALGDVSQINLYVNSPGGEVFEGIAIYNMLKHHPARIDGTVGSLAASMGSVVLMSSDTVSIPENAAIMIHKPWGIQGGDAEDMRRYAELLDQVEGSLVQAYVAKTGKTAEAIHALLDAETWMFGSDAVEAGFADKILEPLKAFGHINSQRMQEFTNMPEAFKKLLSPRGSVTLPVAPSAPAAAAPVATLTTEQIRAQIIAEEGGRRTAITAAFGGFATAHADLLATCLGDMACSADNARAQLLAKLGADTTPSNVPGLHGHVSNGNLVGDSVRASLEARIGTAELEASNGLNHMSMRELARASLTERGIIVSTLNPMQMVGMAFTHSTSDFGQILLDIAGKSVLLGWEEAPETFQLWTKKGQLSDFKTSSRVGLGEFPSLREVRPGAEYKHITLSDRGEPITLATYGELFAITRQAIINDDLSLLSDVPYKMGQAARATIGDLVYAVLTNPPKMRDGKALFHADRKNLATGAGSELSITSLIAAKTDMASQKTQTDGGKARTLNIRPAYVLTPVALEDKANQLINSASVPGADANSGIINPIRGFAKVIGEPRLDDSSSTQWYMAAKQGSDTIEVAYLNGIDTPYVEQENGFSVDGVRSKVRIDAGVAPSDYRGLYKSAGQ